MDEFCELPGIGPWTAQYVAMRGFADPDAFPSGDLGLLRVARVLGIAQTPKQLLAYSEHWRPWRAYAAQTLWNYEAKSAA
jgi:AraC family transcriptional regulator of adaptative response / DNA-3-methyladenine glycosylase II